MAKTKRKIPKPSTRLPRLPPNKNHGDKKKYDRKKKSEPEPVAPDQEDPYEDQDTWQDRYDFGVEDEEESYDPYDDEIDFI